MAIIDYFTGIYKALIGADMTDALLFPSPANQVVKGAMNEMDLQKFNRALSRI